MHDKLNKQTRSLRVVFFLVIRHGVLTEKNMIVHTMKCVNTNSILLLSLDSVRSHAQCTRILSLLLSKYYIVTFRCRYVNIRL